MKLRTRAYVAVGSAVVLIASAPVSAQLANPNAAEVAQGRNNPCIDPWVSRAVSLVKTEGSKIGRAVTSNGGDGECDIKRYNGGQWNNYDELVRHVRDTFSVLRAQNIFDTVSGNGQIGIALLNPNIGLPADAILSHNGGTFANPANPTPVQMAQQVRISRNQVQAWRAGNTQFLYNGRWYNLVGNDGASLIGNDSAGILSNANAGVVPTGGGNMVAAGGGNVVEPRELQALGGQRFRYRFKLPGGRQLRY
jgi:hypothetical protein